MPTRASATRRCSCSRPAARSRSTSTRSATTSSRSASPCSSPATRAPLKVHVHNERPDVVIGFGLELGSLSRISVENLDNQARDVRETRAAAFTGRRRGRGRRRRPGAAPTDRRWPRPTLPARRHRGRRGRRPRRRSSATSAVAAVVQGGQTCEPEHRRAARGRVEDRRRRGPDPAEQPERGPGRAPGRGDDRSARVGRPDAQRGRGLRRAARARPDRSMPRPTRRR